MLNTPFNRAVGRECVYDFPTEKQAAEFEVFANGKGEDGNPVGIPRHFGKYGQKIG